MIRSGLTLQRAGSVLLAAAAAIGFTGGTPAQAQSAPTVSVSPNSGLTDGQTVTVSGSGFSGGANIGIAMCIRTVDSGNDCDLGTAKVAKAGDDGTFSTSYTVRAAIETPDNGDTNCVPDKCAVGASNIQNGSQTAAPAAVTFAQASPATTTTTAPPSGSNTGGTSGNTTSGASTSTGAAGANTTRSLANTGPSAGTTWLALAGMAMVLSGTVLTRRSRRATAR